MIYLQHIPIGVNYGSNIRKRFVECSNKRELLTGYNPFFFTEQLFSCGRICFCYVFIHIFFFYKKLSEKGRAKTKSVLKVS